MFTRLSQKQCQCCKFLCIVILIGLIALFVDITLGRGSHHSQSLKFVIVVTRHGTRGPMRKYPNDPYYSDKYWPDGQSALTAIGKMQLYNVGITLRQLYNGFLDTNYKSTEFRACSTLIERTLQSAEALLAGLYPPAGYQLWNKNINWQPIPVYPNYLDKQILSTNPEECTHFWKLQNESKMLSVDNSNETNKLIQLVNKNSGLNLSSVNLTTIWDILACEYYNKMELPGWTKSIFPSPLNTTANKQITALVIGNEEMTRLVAGPMMQTFVDSMKKKLNDTENNEHHMLYFSSHDYTILAILTILGFTDIPIVNFAQTLLFELHSDPLLPSGHGLKLFQIDGSTSDRTPVSITIPNCTTLCDFNRFIQLTSKYYDGLNWTKECDL